MNISYIIATWASRTRTSCGNVSPYILEIQLEQLFQWYSHYKHSLREIIIMVPPCCDPYPNFYRKEYWTKRFEMFNIPVLFIDYIGQNKHYSYDQWIQGCMYAQGDYYFLIEDDYCINPQEDVFNLMVNVYRNKFPNNIGYLCQYVVDDKVLGYHAAVSNGMISKTTFQQLQNPLKDYYSIHKYPQIAFCDLFLNYSIPIKDMPFKVEFWNSPTQHIVYFLTEYDIQPIKCVQSVFIT